ncbi:MAG TPA: two-component sensor histidine kinase, partial [Kiloniellales bacterium]|nr:two-component sensor histidine kinase [Kiloniellales bacterium]
MTSSANLEAGAGPDGMRHGGGGTLGRRLAAWAQRVGLERKLALVLLVATVTSGTVTFAAMTGNLQIAVDPRAILLLLVVDLVLLLALSTLIVRRLVILWTAHKRGLAGAQLHTRLVLLFSLVAVTPSIVVATFSVILFDFGLQAWFSDRVRTALEQSIAVAEAYLEEHRQNIAADALAIAQDLDRDGMSLALNPERFNALLEAQAGVRSLTEVMVFDSEGRVLGRAGFSLLLDFDPQIPDWAMRRA